MALPTGRQAAAVRAAAILWTGPAGDLADELVAAAARLGARHPAGCLFHEDREDLRIVLDSAGRREIVHSRHRGTAARADALSSRGAYLSGWAPGDARRLVAAVVEGTRPGREARGGGCGEGPYRLDSGKAVRAAERLVHLASLRAGQAALVSASWVEAEQEVLIARPGTPLRHDSRTGRRIRVEVQLDGGRASAVAERALEPGERPDLERLAASAVDRARARREAAEPVPGDLPVVFSAGVGGILLHEIVGHALEADSVRRGASLLASVEGPVAPAHVTVLDDPRRGRAAWRVDDEGFESRATALLQGGRVRGLLHSEATARRAGCLPTGHGRRASFQEPVLPRMGCTFLAPGRLRTDDVLDGIARGVVVRRMEKASADPRTGVALFAVTDADAVREGRVREPLSRFHLYVTTVTALATLDRVASDLAFDSCVGSCVRAGQAMATSVGAPTFRIGLAKVVI